MPPKKPAKPPVTTTPVPAKPDATVPVEAKPGKKPKAKKSK